MSINQFSCPHCHQALSLDDLMTSSIATQLRVENQDAIRAERERAKKVLDEQLATKDAAIAAAQETVELAKREKIEAEKKIEERQANLDDEAQRIAQVIVAKEKTKITFQVKVQSAATITDLEARLKAAEEATNQSTELESALRLKLRETEAAAKVAKVELDRKLDEERLLAEQTGFARASEEAKKQTDALAHQNNSLQAEIAELQRKAILGSQQAQGERLELQIEAMLKTLFPLDEIKEVKKGAHGADVIQRVMSASGKHLGTIVWETKNTQHWKNDWIDKLKADVRDANGQIGISLSYCVFSNSRFIA